MKHFRAQLMKLGSGKRSNKLALLVVVLIFAGFGTYTLLFSSASAPTASLEAESGTVTCPAAVGTDSTASGGSYIEFGATTSCGGGGGTSPTGYTLPPTKQANGLPNQWYWEISPNNAGVAGLPAISAAYPAPGSANIWDTDLFEDAGTTGTAGIPNGASPVVQAIHAAGHYSICYVEAGAQQQGFPDFNNFAAADYTNGSLTTTQMQGYAGENWFDLRGFANYAAGNSATLTGAAPNIAAGLDQRIAGCKAEGQDAVEPDDLDGYTNQSQTGAAGGGWGLTQADSAGFERWLAYDVHSHGLAIFQKNDPSNEPADVPLYDGMIIEECNFYNDPCAGSGGDATGYLAAGKPVLNAEYEDSDKETTAKFCSADISAGIVGSLFDVNLDGKSYTPCQD